jgi:Domain of unknown function (DUF4920)
MKTQGRRIATAFALGLVAQAASAGTPSVYGKKLEGLAPSRLEEVLSRPEAGKQVRLEGTIEKVCEQKGCWLELKQGAQSVHVTFAGYSFFVPKDSAGQPVVLEGRVVVKEPKPADVEHKQAEGAGPSAAAKVWVEATGVQITR